MNAVVGMERTPEHNAKIGAALKRRGRGSSPTKSCPCCGIEKPRSEFGRRSNGYSKSHCRECERVAAAERWEQIDVLPGHRERARKHNRKATLKRYYGITPDDYDAMFEAQGGVCAICGGDPIPSRRNLDVDHCHTTGAIRGLLCSHCNRGLGALFDNPALLRAAADYIERHNGEVEKSAWLASQRRKGVA